MRLNRVLGLVGLALVSSVGLVTAAPYGGKNLLAKRATANCDAAQLPTLNAGLMEAKAMLQAMISRTEDLATYLRRATPENINSQSPLLRSTGKTFESIFGQIYFGYKDDRNAAGLARVLIVLQFASNMLKGIENIANADLEIYCSDLWLFPFDREGNTRGQYWYFDHRPTSGEGGWIDFAKSNGICRDDTSIHYAWVNPNIWRTTTSVLTLCQDWVTQWITLYNNGDTLTKAASLTFADGEKNLDMFSGFSLGMVFLHELSHAPAIVGDNILNDEDCSVDGQVQSAYGWKCITHLAQTDPPSAANNADNFAYYAAAMYLSNNDWSTGLSAAL